MRAEVLFLLIYGYNLVIYFYMKHYFWSHSSHYYTFVSSFVLWSIILLTGYIAQELLYQATNLRLHGTPLLALTLYLTSTTTPRAPRPHPPLSHLKLSFDEDRLSSILSTAIQIPTVSIPPPGTQTPAAAAPFHALASWLRTAYPLLHTTAPPTPINELSLVFYIPGSDHSLLPAAFLGHLDVVPGGEAGQWAHGDPFSGAVAGGEVWGRGAQDMKSHVVCMLDSVEQVIRAGKKFRRGLYICLGHDEEVSTTFGAPAIVNWFKNNHIELEFCLDEGGVVIDGSIFGIDSKVALIGTAEKGVVDVTLTAREEGGHASQPGRKNAVVTLSKALVRLQKRQLGLRWTHGPAQMFRVLTPHMPLILRAMFNNVQLFGGVILKLASLVPSLAAMFRTTMCITQITGADAANIAPTKATANVNVRVLPEDSVAKVLEHIKHVVGDDIEVTVENQQFISTSHSTTASECYSHLKAAIEETFYPIVVAPFTFVAVTDSRYYAPICRNIYRFSPFMFDAADRACIHSYNERVPVKMLPLAAQFFYRVLEKEMLE